jgi:hypothetical protein
MSILYFVIAIVLLLWSFNKSPVLAMWIFIFLITDPGGFFAVYLTKGSLFGGLYYLDIFSFSIIIAVFFNKLKFSNFFKDVVAKRLFSILLLFTFYQLVIFGYIIPEVEDDEYLRFFILRQRFSIFSFILIVPVYLIAIKNLRVFFWVIIVLGSIVLISFLITILTGIKIVPVLTGDRYLNSGVIRLGLHNRGLLYYLISFALIIYVTKIKIKVRNFIIVIGLISLISALITLTKGVIIFASTQVIYGIYIVRKCLNIKLTKVVRNSLIFTLILFGLLFIFMPKYIGHISRGFSDIISLGTQGQYDDREESRVTRELPAMLFMIGQRPFWGTGFHGYKKQLTSDKFGYGAYDTSDVSVLGNLMHYGIIGFSIYLIFYFQIILIIIRFIRVLLKIPRLKLINEYKYEFIFGITSISFFIANFAKIHNFTYELISGPTAVLIFINTGILLACYRRFKEILVFESSV